MLTACEEHIEIALDEFVDTYEVPPEFTLVNDTVAGMPKCHFCESPAKYMLSKDEQ